jgi:hypothetical protein
LKELNKKNDLNKEHDPTESSQLSQPRVLGADAPTPSLMSRRNNHVNTTHSVLYIRLRTQLKTLQISNALTKGAQKLSEANAA